MKKAGVNESGQQKKIHRITIEMSEEQHNMANGSLGIEYPDLSTAERFAKAVLRQAAQLDMTRIQNDTDQKLQRERAERLKKEADRLAEEYGL